MTSDSSPSADSTPGEVDLEQELVRLRKINRALMDKVERGMDLSGGAYSIFQAATLLEQKVHERTQALEAAKESLERSNVELVLAKESAETALRTKDEFLASMSHELRTPLNAILGASESLLEGIQGPITAEQERSLEVVQSSGRHLLALINDILDVARVGAGELKLNLERVPAKVVAQASLNIVSGAATKQGISLTLTTPAEELPCLLADERRVKQILVNLLGNAIKFTPRGGSVVLRLALNDHADQVRFAVSDTGVGIADHNLETLFKPFVQLESSLSRRFEGTGLGLSLVASMAELHGGSVSVQSELSKGSTFTVSLPTAPHIEGEPRSGADGCAEEAVHSVLSPAPERIGHRPQILVVEDNQANIDVTVPYLEATGYDVFVATGGAQAIRMASSQDFDAILMDIQMPEVNGLEATERIRAAESGTPVLIIALTALAMPGDRERCLAAGADEHITKPVRLRDLGQTLGSLLESRRETSPAQSSSP